MTEAVRVRGSRGHRLAHAVGLHGAGRLLRDFATYLPTQAIPAVVGFVALPFLARKLEPTDFGVLAIAQTLISLGWTVSGQWLVVTIVRELPRFRARGELTAFNRTLVRGLAATTVSAALFAVLLGVGSAISSAIGGNALLIFAATVGLVVQNVAVSLFAASLRPRAYAAVEVSARVGGIGLGIALVATGHGVSGYLVGLAASSATIGAIGVFLSWPRAGAAARPEEEPAEGGAPATALRAWIAYGVPASFGATLLWGLSFVDRYLVALFKNAAAVGVYSMGSALGDRVVMVPMFAFAAASGPLLVTAFETKGRDEVERLLTEYSRVLLLVALPCAAFIAAVGPTLVTVIAGIHYALYGPAATVAPIVAVGSVLYGLSTLAMTGLAVSRQTRYLALSAGIGMGAYLLSVNYWAREHARWRVPWGTLVRALVAALAGYGALRIVPAPHNRVERILADAALGAAVYVLALAVLGERRRFAVRPV